MAYMEAYHIFRIYKRDDGNGDVNSAGSPFAVKDEDGFDYSVKYPDYLSLTGNLAVGFPGTDEDLFTDGLIIWPKFSGGYEYGVILDSLEEGGDGYMFYIDVQGNAIEDKYRQVSEKYADVIAELLERADGYWSDIWD